MKKLIFLIPAICNIISLHGQNSSNPQDYIISRFIDSTSKEVVEMVVPGKPPDNFRMPVALILTTSTTLPDVPAYEWSFGCASTSAAMMAGYYDRTGYCDVYNGPTNGGVAPLDNSVWGSIIINGEVDQQCPISATRSGLDGRTTRGHVDDYWRYYGNSEQDPYITNGWIQHTYCDCTGDYMKTNQSAYNNSDGATSIYYYSDGSPYSGTGSNNNDGMNGVKLFFQSRGYTVASCYTQLIYGYNGNTLGFTFSQYKQEIDAGRPIIILVSGHAMLGFGYDITGSIVYLHDTWDYSTHTMTWGGTYSGLQHFAVGVIELQPPPPITIMNPNGGESWQSGSIYTISWFDNITENVKIELFKGGIYNSTIVSSTSSTGSYVWTIPSGQIPGADYKIKITSTTNNSIYDFSNSNFSIDCQTFIVGSISSSQTILYGTAPAPLIGITPTGGVPPYTYQWQSSLDGISFTDISGATDLNYSPGVLLTTTSYRQLQSSSTGCGPLPTNVLIISIIYPAPPCSGFPTVTYGGKIYNTVQIGTQCWFKENLNIGTKINGSQNQTNNGVIEKYCYNDLETNCDVYGGLYQWNEMMQYVTTEGTQGICPSGWHLPTFSEQVTLTSFLGGQSVAGGKMKEIGTSHWLSPNTGATNESGFTGIPGGLRLSDGSFAQITQYAHFWSTSQYSSTMGYSEYLSYMSQNLFYYDELKDHGLSVRCLTTCTSFSNVSINIVASANPVCTGTSVTYTAIPTNGGTTPFYQWKKNGTNVGTNSPTYTYTPVNNDAITCVLTSNLTCVTGNPATSDTITMIVNETLPVSVMISPSANPVCTGTSVTYTATPTNGGATPSYQWKVNGINKGSNSTTYTYIPLNGDNITCQLTSNGTCVTGNPATSNTITMMVNATLQVNVSISPSANPVCTGTSVTFTATPTNGGTTPSYQWKVNGINVGSNSTTYTYIPLNGDNITCQLTSSGTCVTGNPATSNAITMTVNPIPLPTISGSNTLCQGTTGVLYNTPVITGYTYQWVCVGGTITSGQNTYQITISWGLGTSGYVYVIATNTITGCIGQSTNYNVTLLPLPTPVISGPIIVIAGDTVNYSTSAITGHLYTWNINGGTIISGQNTAQIVVTWGTAGSGTVTVYETNIATQCVGQNSINVTIGSSGTLTLSGIVQYDNPYLTPLNGVFIKLYRNAFYTGLSTTTATQSVNGVPIQGYYQFPGLIPGNYSLIVSYDGTWGGVNSTDALVIELYTCCSYPLPGLLWSSGDVDLNAVVNGTDALWVKYRTVGLTNYFPAGNWIFNNAPFIVTGNTTYNFMGLCTGDANASYIPTGFKSQSFISVVDDGTRYISTGQSFNFEIKPTINTEIGAVTLFLGYDQGLVDIENVKSSIGEMQYNLSDNGKIGLAWSAINPVTTNESKPIITLQMKAKEFIPEPTRLFNIEGGSEFANPNAEKISGLDLKMPKLATITNSFSISNYPNPFQNSTTIVYNLPEQGRVMLTVTNVYGQTLHTLVNTDQMEGIYKVTVDPAELNLQPGVYMYKIEVNGVISNYNQVNKMIFTR